MPGKNSSVEGVKLCRAGSLSRARPPARSPEMFELDKAPSAWDPSTNAVIAGRDRVRLFDGALLALRELSSKASFAETHIAVASSTSRKPWAMECLQLFEVSSRSNRRESRPSPCKL